MPFGVVSRVGSNIDVIDRGPHAPKSRDVLEVFLSHRWERKTSHRFEGRFERIFKTEKYLTRA